jgi:hypothetical protein
VQHPAIMHAAVHTLASLCPGAALAACSMTPASCCLLQVLLLLLRHARQRSQELLLCLPPASQQLGGLKRNLPARWCSHQPKVLLPPPLSCHGSLQLGPSLHLPPRSISRQLPNVSDVAIRQPATKCTTVSREPCTNWQQAISATRIICKLRQRLCRASMSFVQQCLMQCTRGYPDVNLRTKLPWSLRPLDFCLVLRGDFFPA